MKKLEQQVRQFVRSGYFPLLALGIVEIIFHLIFMKPFYGDDQAYAHMLDDIGLLEWSKGFFMGWSSRVFLNGTIAVFARFPAIMWQLINVGMILLVLYSMLTLTGAGTVRRCGWAAVVLFLMYPFMHMASAGWMATTISYLWTAAAGLYCCTLLKKDAHWYHFLLCGVAAVYAANIEQTAVILSVLFICFTLYGVFTKQREAAGRALFLLLPTAANLCLHLLSPGNAVRTGIELARFDQDFKMRSIIGKIQLGFSETMSKFLFSPNLIFLFLTGITAVIIWRRFQKHAWRYILAIPFAVCLCVGFGSSFFLTVFPGLSILSPMPAVPENGLTAYGGLVTFDNFLFISSYIPLLVMAICMFICALGIWVSIEDMVWSMLAVLVYFCGVGSGMVMGFSPTLYASGGRTLSDSCFCFIFVILVLLYQNDSLFSKRDQDLFFAASLVPAGLNVINIVAKSAMILSG